MVPELIANNALKLHSAIDKPSDLIPPPLFCKNLLIDATIRQLLGEVVCAYLAHPTQELSANYEQESGRCRLFVDDGSGPMRPLDVFLDSDGNNCGYAYAGYRQWSVASSQCAFFIV